LGIIIPRMPLKPEAALRKRVKTLERHKATYDMMIDFLKTHPTIVTECSIHQLTGKLGLKFGEYALAVPYHTKGGGFTLRLIKSGEDWTNNHDSNEMFGKRLAAEDITNMPDEELEKLLDSVRQEANPDGDFDDEEEDDES
jgi:hypothetical protein